MGIVHSERSTDPTGCWALKKDLIDDIIKPKIISYWIKKEWWKNWDAAHETPNLYDSITSVLIGHSQHALLAFNVRSLLIYFTEEKMLLNKIFCAQMWLSEMGPPILQIINIIALTFKHSRFSYLLLFFEFLQNYVWILTRQRTQTYERLCDRAGSWGPQWRMWFPLFTIYIFDRLMRSTAVRIGDTYYVCIAWNILTLIRTNAVHTKKHRWAFVQSAPSYDMPNTQEHRPLEKLKSPMFDVCALVDLSPAITWMARFVYKKPLLRAN